MKLLSNEDQIKFSIDRNKNLIFFFAIMQNISFTQVDDDDDGHSIWFHS